MPHDDERNDEETVETKVARVAREVYLRGEGGRRIISSR
jgi:hypothetical protein